MNDDQNKEVSNDTKVGRFLVWTWVVAGLITWVVFGIMLWH